MHESSSPRAAARVATFTLALAVGASSGAARADAERGEDTRDLETIALFDAAKLEAPENLAMDSRGNLFVNLALTGEIRRFAPDGEQSLFATLPMGGPPLTPCGTFVGGMTGLAIDRRDNLYVGLASCDAEARGVWKVTPEGEKTQLTQLPMAALPNGVAFRHGKLYVADSALGVVWRLDAEHPASAEVWSADPLLSLDTHVFPGPNGAQFFHDELYVSNPDRLLIAAIPIDDDGNAGPARLHAEGVPCDDFAFDVHGSLYCGTDPFNTLLRVDQDGTSEVVLSAAEGLDGTTAALFGRFGEDRASVYITNGALPFYSMAHRPSLMRLDLEVVGAPRL